MIRRRPRRRRSNPVFPGSGPAPQGLSKDPRAGGHNPPAFFIFPRLATACDYRFASANASMKPASVFTHSYGTAL
jgi:hypothetical protein